MFLNIHLKARWIETKILKTFLKLEQWNCLCELLKRAFQSLWANTHIHTHTLNESTASQMSNSEIRNNEWAAARSSLITATSPPLNPSSYFPCHLWSSHLCNSLLGEQASVSLSRVTVQDFTPAVASRKCGSTSSWTQSIHINFKQEEPISSSLATVSEPNSHSIHIMHKSYVLCRAHEDQVV